MYLPINEYTDDPNREPGVFNKDSGDPNPTTYRFTRIIHDSSCKLKSCSNRRSVQSSVTGAALDSARL
jgi:hypothetical protein